MIIAMALIEVHSSENKKSCLEKQLSLGSSHFFHKHLTFFVNYQIQANIQTLATALITKENRLKTEEDFWL
jgi:hypothetical protein